MAMRFPSALKSCLYFTFLYTLGMLNSGPLFADEYTAKIRFEHSATQSAITGFQIKDSNPTLTITKNNPGAAAEVSLVLEGEFNNPKWSLGMGRKKGGKPGYVVSSTLDFPAKSVRMKIPLFSNTEKIYLASWGPGGPGGPVTRDSLIIEIEDESLLSSLSSRTPSSVERKSKASTSKSDSSSSRGAGITLSVGVTTISYSETLVKPITELLITPRLALQVPLGAGWSLGANTYFTAIPLSSNVSNLNISFLGANLRVGYALPFITSPWNLTINLGVYYSTTFTSGAQFGYSGLIYPLGFVTLSYSQRQGNSISVYGKYAPLSQGFSLSLEQAEFGFGLSYALRLSQTNALVLSLDATSFGFQSTSIVAINLSTLGLSCGLRF